MKIVHISDLHLTSLETVTARQLFNKRILGYLSWKYRRRHIHKRETLSGLMQHIAGENSDLIAITGDLTHIGTPQEYREAREWLDATSDLAEIFLVPGNHDFYTRTDAAATTALWQQYWRGDAGSNDESMFPTLRMRGKLALIGVNTGLPTAPLHATGCIGERQLLRLGHLLDQTRDQGLFRLVLIHHGPVAGTYRKRKRLLDEDEFTSLIAGHGAELIIHGHGHVAVENRITAGDTSIPVLGAPSASATTGSPAAGYIVYNINNEPGAWVVNSETRMLDPASGELIEAATGSWRLPAGTE